MTTTGQLVLVPVKPHRQYRSCFKDFFIEEEGVISLSLKSLTILGSVITTCYLLFIAYYACYVRHDVNCEWKVRRPTISDIIMLPYYDRSWGIIVTFFSLTV